MNNISDSDKMTFAKKAARRMIDQMSEDVENGNFKIEYPNTDKDYTHTVFCFPDRDIRLHKTIKTAALKSETKNKNE